MQFFFNLILLSYIISSSFCASQTVIHQDIFKGGVTGDGFNPGFSYNSGSFNVHIENGSTIRNAYLFCTAYNSPISKKIIFNGVEIYLSTTNSMNYNFNANFDNLHNNNLEVIVTDVKSYISPTQNTYTFTPPYQISHQIGGGYSDFYLYISYDNATYPAVNSVVFCNDLNTTATLSYNLNAFNPIDLLKPVSLAIGAGSFCDIIDDASYIKVNSDVLGLLGGDEYNSATRGSGVAGSFFYQNENLFGLGNDTPNNTMSGADALANISQYITNNLAFDVEFEYVGLWPHSNPVFQLFLTYVSTCEPFDVTVSSDTTICQNSPLQLQASGGIRYEWQPATGLSCTNCPNPIVSTDSSMFYTVRIWNNDTCSVVRSVNVMVDSLPDFSSIVISPSICGDSTGSVIAKGTQPSKFSIDGSIPKVSGIFNNLTPGNHTLTVYGENGCGKDSVIFISETITVNASFTANPPSGGAPLAVVFTNNSTNADGYEWFVDSVSHGANLSSYVFDSVGVYTTTLIAWQNNPACADTFIVHIYVNDTLIVQVPNVFTPNNDGNNDLFGITTNIPVYIDFQIFNRWGNVMVSGKDLKSLPTVSFTPLWNGEDAVDGTYFYQITVRSVEDASLIVKSDGFVQLVK